MKKKVFLAIGLLLLIGFIANRDIIVYGFTTARTACNYQKH
ncbi:MAG: hypothetical protein R2847_03605 [Bacteroidia bacterium]